MAYNTDNEIREDLGVFDRNDRGDKVSVTKITNKTNDSVAIDIRNMYTNDEGELKHTQKGVRLNEELTLEVVTAILKGMSESDLMDVLSEIEK